MALIIDVSHSGDHHLFCVDRWSLVRIYSSDIFCDIAFFGQSMLDSLYYGPVGHLLVANGC